GHRLLAPLPQFTGAGTGDLGVEGNVCHGWFHVSSFRFVLAAVIPVHYASAAGRAQALVGRFSTRATIPLTPGERGLKLRPEVSRLFSPACARQRSPSRGGSR